MELANKNTKRLDFHIASWQLHSQNVDASLRARAFIANKYTRINDVEVATARENNENRNA